MTEGGCQAIVVNEAHEVMNFCIYSSCCSHRPAETKPSTHSLGVGECVDLLSAPWLLFQQEEFMQKSIAHVAQTVHMMMIKVVERARGRNGSGRRGHDGRGQPRAARAAAGSMEGPPVTDGAVGGKIQECARRPFCFGDWPTFVAT